ncbi:MAG: DUF262 domain-containing protein [Synergistaceae bacterium]|nr:DUF262 domain-containing protein [Synergistaceae bacterium]
MSSLSAEQKSIEEFMGSKKNFFLIPDYQRPYSWEDEECLTLWNDLFAFVFPDNDYNCIPHVGYFFACFPCS